jgi:hypothetical protein
MSLLPLLLGVGAAIAALMLKRTLVRPLGPGYWLRFLAVQAGVINVLFWALLQAIAKQSGWENRWAWLVAYVVLFFFYSLSNIDWTIKKFHTAAE